MTFSSALDAMKAGKKVRRPGWGTAVEIDNVASHDFSKESYLADDWEIITVPQPPPTIEELRQAIVSVADNSIPANHWQPGLDTAIDKIRRPSDAR